MFHQNRFYANAKNKRSFDLGTVRRLWRKESQGRKAPPWCRARFVDYEKGNSSIVAPSLSDWEAIKMPRANRPRLNRCKSRLNWVNIISLALFGILSALWVSSLSHSIVASVCRIFGFYIHYKNPPPDLWLLNPIQKSTTGPLAVRSDAKVHRRIFGFYIHYKNPPPDLWTPFLCTCFS